MERDFHSISVHKIWFLVKFYFLVEGDFNLAVFSFPRWYKQDSPVEDSDRIQRIGSSLSISHVEESDSGLWNCVANNSEGQDKMQIYIQVNKNNIEISSCIVYSPNIQET